MRLPEEKSPKSAPNGWTLVPWASAAFAALVILGLMTFTYKDMFRDLSTWGGHDWDMISSFRYIAVKSMKTYRQFPYWNPYACGGYPLWGYSEGGTTVLTPWALLYLVFPLRLALRLEVVSAALVLASGMWLLTGRFTRSTGARLLAVSIVTFNSRWAMQAGTGHAMHLYYCLMPWALFFFDKALELRLPMKERIRNAALASIPIALMAYAGGIYPLPHTLMALGLYAVTAAMVAREWTAVGMAALSAVLGMVLAAPKMIPVLDSMRRHPRLTDSPENLSPAAFMRLLVGDVPVPVSHWGWHEWGMYVGWIPFLAAILAVAFARGQREWCLKIVGLVLVVFGFGNFDPKAPWTLLHELPIFKSQHVPSRWLFPALLVLSIVIASWLGGLFERSRNQTLRLAWGVALALGASWIGYDVARIAKPSFDSAFWMKMQPSLVEERDAFSSQEKVPPELHYLVRDWAPPSLPAAMSNVDTVECWSVVPLSIYARDKNGRVVGLGARGKGHPEYRGEVFTESGKGTARIQTWSPNKVVVRVEGVTPGDRVLLNQNYDPGWRVNGQYAEDYKEVVSGRALASEQELVFQYRPRTQWWAALIGLGGLLLLLGLVGAIPRRLLQGIPWRRRRLA